MNMQEAGAERAGYAAQIKAWLEAIMFGMKGEAAHEWGYVIDGEVEQ